MGSFEIDRKSTRLNSSHVSISYAVFCLKKKKTRGESARGPLVPADPSLHRLRHREPDRLGVRTSVSEAEADRGRKDDDQSTLVERECIDRAYESGHEQNSVYRTAVRYGEGLQCYEQHVEDRRAGDDPARGREHVERESALRAP